MRWITISASHPSKTMTAKAEGFTQGCGSDCWAKKAPAPNEPIMARMNRSQKVKPRKAKRFALVARQAAPSV